MQGLQDAQGSRVNCKIVRCQNLGVVKKLFYLGFFFYLSIFCTFLQFFSVQGCEVRFVEKICLSPTAQANKNCVPYIQNLH